MSTQILPQPPKFRWDPIYGQLVLVTGSAGATAHFMTAFAHRWMAQHQQYYSASEMTGAFNQEVLRQSVLGNVVFRVTYWRWDLAGAWTWPMPQPTHKPDFYGSAPWLVGHDNYAASTFEPGFQNAEWDPSEKIPKKYLSALDEADSLDALLYSTIYSTALTVGSSPTLGLEDEAFQAFLTTFTDVQAFTEKAKLLVTEKKTDKK